MIASTRRIERTPRRCDPQRGHEQHAPEPTGVACELRRASVSLCAIQSGLNTIQEVALIERLGQIADDPGPQCAGTNIIARIGSYQYGWNLFAQSRQIVVQIKATHPGHVEVDNQAAGAAEFG